MITPGFNVLIDGQWGSTGKGKLAAYIASQYDIDVVVSDFQANAGHTSIFDDGRKIVVHTVPTGAINLDAHICLSPASTISIKRLFEEIEVFGLNERRLSIHPNVMVIAPEHIEEEQKLMKNISSTCQGVGAALCAKIRRVPTPRLAKDIPELKDFIRDTTMVINQNLRHGGTVLMETAQGFDLSINFGKSYPYTTSRDVTVGSALNNAGVSPIWLQEVIGVLRTYPIRVGNVMEDGKITGYSGDYYSDQRELTWDEVTQLSGSTSSISEKTTVTQKIRRVFTFSDMQLKKFMSVCTPTQLAIMFVDYLDHNLHGSSDAQKITSSPNVRSFLDRIKDVLAEDDCRITYLGTGPKNSECIFDKEGL